MSTSLHRLLLCVIATIVLTNQALASSLDPVSLRYTIRLDSDRFGKATLGRIASTVQKTDLGYQIKSVTRAEGMAAIILGSNFEESCEFAVNEGRAITNEYQGGRIGKTDYEVGFDWKGRKISFSNGESMDMPQGYIVDNCSMWFATALLKGEGLGSQPMYVVDGKKHRIRGFSVRSTEDTSIDTRLGTKEVLKLVLERELRPDRTVTFWLDKDNQYLPVRMEESRKSRTTTFEIESIEALQ